MSRQSAWVGAELLNNCATIDYSWWATGLSSVNISFQHNVLKGKVSQPPVELQRKPRRGSNDVVRQHLPAEARSWACRCDLRWPSSEVGDPATWGGLRCGLDPLTVGHWFHLHSHLVWDDSLVRDITSHSRKEHSPFVGGGSNHKMDILCLFYFLILLDLVIF